MRLGVNLAAVRVRGAYSVEWSGSANLPGTFLGRIGAPWPLSHLRLFDGRAEVKVRPFGPRVSLPLDGQTFVTSLYRLPRTRGVLLRRGDLFVIFSAGRYNDDVEKALVHAGAVAAERPAYWDLMKMVGRRERPSRLQLALRASPFVAIGVVEAFTETLLPWPW